MLPELKSKRSILVLTSLLFLCISFVAKSQCDVTITPQGATTFCEGDSVTLVAYANSDSMMLDQSQTLYDGGTSARNLPGYSYWQSFEASVTGTLVQIDAGFFTLIDGMSEGQITIKTDAGLVGSNFSLYNTIGEQILNVRLQNEITTLDVGNSSGMYLYVVRNSNQIISSGKISVEK